MQIPLDRMYRDILILCKVSFAAIGVCVFCAQLRLRTFYFQGEVIMEEKITKINASDHSRALLSVLMEKRRMLEACLDNRGKELLKEYDKAFEDFFWTVCDAAYADGISK